jgi:TPR repeat protein
MIYSLVIITLLLLLTVSSGFIINLNPSSSSATATSTSTTTTTTTRQHSIITSTDNDGDGEVLSHGCGKQKEEEEEKELYNEIYKKIQLVALELWKGDEITLSTIIDDACANNNNNNNNNNTTIFSFSEGEATLEPNINFSERCSYFKNKAIHTGCPASQHSYGLLLWNGYSTTTGSTRGSASASASASDAVLSAKFHSAAALQHHLDGIAIMGGIIRTGTGIPKKFKNIELGIQIIDYCASVGNPAGINKKAALLEKEDNYVDAVQLYENSILNGRINALLLFNLGWCLINGRNENNKKDSIRGIQLWKDAVALAPDQGSEEAAWFLYKEYERDDPKEAKHWYDIAIDLGYYE